MTEAQKVVVTAAGSGIGRAIAECFAASGAKVHICDVAEDAMEDALGANEGMRGTKADIGDPKEVEAVFEDAVAWMGGLDVLINNAGIGGPRAALEDIEYADWDRTVRVNLNGAFYCIKQATPIMKRQRGGCIINISTSSVRTGLPLRAPYVASKAGLMGLTKNVARELGPYNIRCNAILPGLIDNARGRGLVANMAEEQGLSDDEADAEFRKYISMQTWIDMSEIGETAVFLASHAGRHISGQFLAVDGNVEWEI